jgi:hypothetical protein
MNGAAEVVVAVRLCPGRPGMIDPFYPVDRAALRRKRARNRCFLDLSPHDMQVPRTRRGKLAARKGGDSRLTSRRSNRSTPVSPRSAGLDEHGQAAQNLRGLPRTVP